MVEDWSEFVASLLSQNVDFLMVGAHALAVHGRARFTEDLDIFLNRSAENKLRLSRALKEFGVEIADEQLEKLFREERQMAVFGRAPFSIDLLNFLDGVSFEFAWEN